MANPARKLASFEIVDMTARHADQCIRVTVDSAAHDRCYVVDWALANLDLSERCALVKHAGPGEAWSTSDISPNDVWEVARFLDCSDELAAKVERELAMIDPR